MKEFHPVANIFPLLQGDEFDEFCQDIKLNGLLEAIWLHPDGQIVDGRNRYNACLKVGVEPMYRTWEGQGSLTDFVLSLNLHRRHLTTGQKGAVGVMVEEQYLIENKSRVGGRPVTRTSITGGNIATSNAKADKVKSRDQAAQVVGISPRTIQEAKRIKRDAPGIFEQVKTGDVELQDAKRLTKLPTQDRQEAQAMVSDGNATSIKSAIKKIETAKQIEAIADTTYPEGKYHVIVMDPPWRYEKRREDVTHRALVPYPDMTIDEIRDWEKDNGGVPGLALDDCILWLWTTNAHMKQAHDLAEAWGFNVKTILTWVKSKMGTGDWLRGKSEHCLMCVKGKPVINLTNQTTVLEGPLREHSRKPDEFYAMVDQLCPGLKIDIFSREQREGWKTYGNEQQKFTETF